MNRFIKLIGCLTCAALLSGCTSLARYPDNPPLARFDPQQRAAGLENRGSGDILLVLTFSGGGSRAAALAYGVLEALSQTPLGDGVEMGSMLDEVDIISAVSGGSVTAAYYGVHGKQLFTRFRRDFLQRDVTTELKTSLLKLGTLSRLSSETFGSGDVLDEYFRERLFGNASLNLLLDAEGPFVQINATDLFKGGQFGFTRDQFALICSDIDQFPISRAVAASSAVPLIFSPVTLSNRAGSCDYTPPDWFKPGLQEKGRHNRRHRIASNMRAYLDQTAHPYIHLVDGGLADNLGLRAVMDYIVIEGGLWNTLKRFKLDNARDIVVISLDASALLPSQWEQSDTTPPNMAILDAATTTPLLNYNFETLEYLRGNLASWRRELELHKCEGRPGCQAPQIYHIDLQLEGIADADRRKRLASIPTDFNLPSGAAAELIEAAHQLLQDHPEYQRLMERIETRKK